MHSGTKFLGGHNDTLAGFLVTNRADISEKLRFLIKTTGSGLAPFDSWLILRGIKTLGIRMEQAQKNAFKIAEWLKTKSAVTRVIYPGLPDHPGYEIMKKQARGFGSMLTFQLESREFALSVLEKVRMIKFAESLGGVETLITYPTTQTHADVPKEIRERNGITEATLRLSVGIEDAQDLLDEFEKVFAEDVDPEKYVEDHGLKTVNDEGALRTLAEEVIAKNPKAVEDFKGGKEKALGALVGQIMKAMKGKANPGMVNELLREMLNRNQTDRNPLRNK